MDSFSTASTNSDSAQQEEKEDEEKEIPNEDRFYLTSAQMTEYLNLKQWAEEEVAFSLNSRFGYKTVDCLWFDALLHRAPDDRNSH